MRIKKLGIIGVSSRFNPELLDKAISVLKNDFLLEILVSSAVLEWQDPAKKAQAFMDMVFEENIDFLLCARGGEGCADLIPYLEPFREKFKATSHKKIISGMSDNTPLLLFLADCGWSVFYGYVASYFSHKLSLETRESFELLLEKKEMGRLNLVPMNDLAKAINSLEGEVTGGNLTLLNLSLKESWEFNASNKILMIEDWHEQGYQIDRALKHFERIGKFSGLKALIFGNFIGDIQESALMNLDQIKLIQAALDRFAARASFPVFSAENFGHINALKPIKYGLCQIQYNQLSSLGVSI